MSNYDDAAALTMARLEMLGSVSQSDKFLDRRYLSEQHRQANQLTANWMNEAGMGTWQDAAGNIWGRLESAVPEAPRLIFGSHLDTVPNGGKYDGMLGVLAPVTIAALLKGERHALPFHLDVVGFGDEEGTRFGSTLLGSRALTGKWPDDWRRMKDADGIALEEAMQQFGLDFDKVSQAAISGNNVLAYLELHIEQGPVLEKHNLPVGTVTGIAGARRLAFEVTGMAGHAGTVPMEMRQDALCAASAMVLCIQQTVRQYTGVVATVGSMTVKPNAVNVIPGQANFTLDIRSDDNHRRDTALEHILHELNNLAMQHGVTLSHHVTHDAGAVQCAPHLQEALMEATSACGITPFSLPSGAGHDAMAMADICPVAMLFTRCKGGISHHPLESITQDDVAASLAVLHHMVKHLRF